MGAQHSCPPGFERSPFQTCSAICPGDFEKVKQNGDRCAHIRRPNRSFVLQTIPYDAPKTTPFDYWERVVVNGRPMLKRQTGFKDLPPPTPEPRAFATERTRVLREAETTRKQVDDDIAREQLLQDANNAKVPQTHEFSRIQSEYATFRATQDAVDAIRETTSKLRVFRPPTAPATDLETERRAITDIAKRNLFFIQVALFLVVVVLLTYIVLPVEYAHGLAFLLLTVGISLGFFLRR